VFIGVHPWLKIFSLVAAPPRRVIAKQREAFTLLEILIAITIFAIVLGAMNTVFYGAIRLRNKTTEVLENNLPINQALMLMQRDIANIVMPTGTFGGPLQTANPTNALPGQVSPDIYTSDGQLDGIAPWGNIQKVDYVLTSPTNRNDIGQNLCRSVTRNLLPVTQGTTQPDATELILSGVQNVTFTYYDGTQWQAIWDTTTQTNLPVAIKVQIQMATQSGEFAAAPLEIVVPIDLQVTTNVTASMQ